MFLYYENKFEIRPNENPKITIVPSSIADKEEILNFYAQELNFPEYFGENWDAFNECITDLNWLSQKLIKIIHTDIPLINFNDKKIYIDLLEEAVISWKDENEHQLFVYFPESTKDQILEVLKSPSF